MLRIAEYDVTNLHNAVRGMRNPMKSWDRSDSTLRPDGSFQLGEADLSLAVKLCNAGSDHRKFLRQIFVSADIEAPLYWWKEFDTYKVGTVANSTSTMHKIHAQPFSTDDFSTDQMPPETRAVTETLVAHLEDLRVRYLESKDKALWYGMIQLLPSGYNQLRTCTFNYENLRNMYAARRNHKLNEWHIFCDWVQTLPYAADLIVKR